MLLLKCLKTISLSLVVWRVTLYFVVSGVRFVKKTLVMKTCRSDFHFCVLLSFSKHWLTSKSTLQQLKISPCHFWLWYLYFFAGLLDWFRTNCQFIPQRVLFTFNQRPCLPYAGHRNNTSAFQISRLSKSFIMHKKLYVTYSLLSSFISTSLSVLFPGFRQLWLLERNGACELRAQSQWNDGDQN